MVIAWVACRKCGVSWESRAEIMVGGRVDLNRLLQVLIPQTFYLASLAGPEALLVEPEWHAGELARVIQCLYQRHSLKGIFEVRRQGGS